MATSRPPGLSPRAGRQRGAGEAAAAPGGHQRHEVDPSVVWMCFLVRAAHFGVGAKNPGPFLRFAGWFSGEAKGTPKPILLFSGNQSELRPILQFSCLAMQGNHFKHLRGPTHLGHICPLVD